MGCIYPKHSPPLQLMAQYMPYCHIYCNTCPTVTYIAIHALLSYILQYMPYCHIYCKNTCPAVIYIAKIHALLSYILQYMPCYHIYCNTCPAIIYIAIHALLSYILQYMPCCHRMACRPRACTQLSSRSVSLCSPLRLSLFSSFPLFLTGSQCISSGGSNGLCDASGHCTRCENENQCEYTGGIDVAGVTTLKPNSKTCQKEQAMLTWAGAGQSTTHDNIARFRAFKMTLAPTSV